MRTNRNNARNLTLVTLTELLELQPSRRVNLHQLTWRTGLTETETRQALHGLERRGLIRWRRYRGGLYWSTLEVHPSMLSAVAS